MKYTGVIRRVDDLGRLVIPKEFRKMQKIKAGDPLEICLIEDGDMIVRRVDLSAKLINAGKIAKELNISRSVITSTLRKLESSGLLEARSLGMKGTYVRIKDQILIDELRKL